MRPFTLKKTITHATVLSALLPSVAALSQQLHSPVGLSGKITFAAGAAAIIGHEAVPLGFTPMDPKTAPSRGGYVYDSFNNVVRTGITRECVKHGLWSPELATPDCEPYLFATPPAPAPQPKAEAPAPAPAPTTQAAPPPAAKEEGFPEWMGPGEANMGIAPIFEQDGIEAEEGIGLPRMYFDGEGEDVAGVDDRIGEPVLHGDQEEAGIEHPDLISPPIVYYQEGEEAGAAESLISPPRLYDDTEIAQYSEREGEWPADPYAIQESEAAAASNDNWVPTPPPATDEPVTGMMEFKEEEGWPIDKFAEGYVEDQSLAEADTSWSTPNPLPESSADEMVGRYEEGGVEPTEAISNPTMYYDQAEEGFVPPETIVGHTLQQDGEEEGRAGPEDLIIGHSVYPGEPEAGKAPEDLISYPRHYTMEEEPAAPLAQEAAAPYVSPFDQQPYAQADEAEEEEEAPYTSYYDQGTSTPPQPAAEPPAQVAAAAAPSAPPYAEEAEEEEEEEQPYTPDYSKVPVAKLEAPPPAPPPPPAKPTPVAAEEHLMTVVLSADALFDFDRYVLRKPGKKSLDDFVAALKDVNWGQILVVGHTDRLGSPKYNQRLSERRAQAVRKELIARGLDGKKIKAAGKGKTQPVTTDCVGTKKTKELIACLQPDRRVEIFVDEKREVKITKPPKPKN